MHTVTRLAGMGNSVLGSPRSEWCHCNETNANNNEIDYHLELNHDEARVTLAQLKSGCSAVVTALEDTDPSIQRLMCMGIVEGARLTLLRWAPGGDPLELRLYGTALSLRRAQAQQIIVEPANE